MKRLNLSAVLCIATLVGCSETGPTGVLAPDSPARPLPVASYSEAEGEPAVATVSTDKDDYAPGETVVVTGAGWLSGESVVMELAEDPQLHDVVIISSVADAAGTFVNTDFSPDEHDIGVMFTLTATGQTSARTATTTFTDGNPDPPTVSVGQSPSPVTAGNSATYTIMVHFGGNGDACTVGLSAAPGASPAWPSPPLGGYFSFSPGALTGTGNSGPGPRDATSQLTVTTPAGMLANTYAFTVTADTDDTNNNCQGIDEVSGVITLVVVAAAPENTAPNTPASLAQFRSDATTAIAVGGRTNETTVVLKGTVTDPDAGDMVKLQVEVQPVGTAFTNVMTAESGPLASGSTASATVSSLAEGSYHWQGRAVDQDGATSAWTSFGGNGEDAADFIVDTTPPMVTIEQAAAQADPTNASPINFTVVFSEPVFGFATGDVTLGGIAGATTGNVTGGPTTFNVAVSGMTSDGTVTATIAAGVAQDAAGNDNVASTSADNTVIYDMTPPVVSAVAAAPNPTNGTVDVVLTATATDALTNVTGAEYRIDGGAWTAMAAQDGTFDSLSEAVTVTISAATIAGLSEGNHSLCVRAADLATNTSDGTSCTTLTVDKTPPVVSDVAADPNPARYDEAVMITATATDALTNIVSAQYKLDGGAWTAMSAEDGGFDELVEDVKATLAAFGQAGVHDVCVRATDAAGNTSAGTDCILLAVYDPSAGFVTGGGWITSPEGAYRADLLMTGKATFGFVAKYKKGANTPEGNTEFQFHAAGMNFHSDEYDWLVVAGARAQYKGYGTINGVPGFRFLLTAIDGQVNGDGGTDKLRMKIWDAATGGVVYDNKFGEADSGDESTALGGGSIIVHTGKGK